MTSPSMVASLPIAAAAREADSSRLARAPSAGSPHVLFVPSWYPSQAGDIGGSFFREQALALASAGAKVGVVSVHLRSPRDWRSLLKGQRGLAHANDIGVSTIRYHGVNWWTRLPRWFARKWVNRAQAAVESYIANHGRPDVIHAQCLLYGGVVARQAALRVGIPYVVTEHSSGFALGTYVDWQLALARSAAAGASARLAVSASLVRTLRHKLGEVGPWEVVPNMVHRRFLDLTLPPSAPQRSTFDFLSLSGMTRNKNVEGLLHAFRQVRSECADVRLLVGGDGPELASLQSLARELGIAENVRFIGSLARAEVPAAMANADAFVLPSEYETFGVVLIEAMALGLPCVATRCGGPESIIGDREGILIPPGDAEALAAAMLRVRRNRSSYDREDIRSACAERFGEAAIVNRLLETYGQVLRQPCPM